MPALEELARRHTELTPSDLDRLRALLGDWQLVADLAFSDLVLWLPTWNGSGYVAAAQLRPATGATVIVDDVVGTFLPRGRFRLVDDALTQQRVVTARAGAAAGEPHRAVPVPGRAGERVLAVIAQHHDGGERGSGGLEETYRDAADRLAVMIAEGRFPSGGDLLTTEDSPRVGDGLLVLDVAGIVEYASPNARSAYRRLGLGLELVGSALATVSQQLGAVRGPLPGSPLEVLAGRGAGMVEVEARGAVAALRGIPLVAQGRRTGALLLLRDVSDVRRRERELMTKDATIREIHHRVKNNLQTVAALLRLQARRLDGAPGARAALAEAEQRVASIALVHETLSTCPDPDVPFDEVADRLLAMVVEMSLGSGQVQVVRDGTFGALDAELATPLALVLTELAHNALEHGLRGGAGTLTVHPARAERDLVVSVEDDGVGLAPGLDPLKRAGLGLQIVRTLVSDLGGDIVLGDRPGGGTRALVRIPLPE